MCGNSRLTFCLNSDFTCLMLVILLSQMALQSQWSRLHDIHHLEARYVCIAGATYAFRQVFCGQLAKGLPSMHWVLFRAATTW